ncbi:MAG: hypothetical protein VB074_03775 [Proteiniphilum sp.]|uniref:hypothetical protein n=1 Tax=Proteiniphilum sp. TaxID=1926877 RepID=UPI002B1EACF5|nr:hypothetical protein [Proteiniphilum sp.]MEA5127278.1 hypothetical protein [Proteiniphilum sp.]
MKSVIKKTTLIILFICLSTNLETGIYYLFFFIICFLFFIYIVATHKVVKLQKVDLVALSFIVVWAYGLILGLVKENNMSYVFSNFAGMICYSLYFMLVNYRIHINSLIKIVLVAGLILSLLSCIGMVSFQTGMKLPSFLNGDITFSSTGQVRIYTPTLPVAFSLLGLSFYQILYNNKEYKYLRLNKRINSIFIFIISFASIFIVTASKGFSLGGIYVILIISLFSYGSQLARMKFHSSFILFILLIIVGIVALYRLGYFNIFTDMFSSEDIANVARYTQLDFILDDITFWGNGLGSIVPGFISNREAPYGYELIFLNIIHKFGIFSIFLFFNWIYMFIFLFKRCWNKKNIFTNVIMLSSLGYLFTSIGNPILFHPSLVMLNVITLYHIRQEKRNENEKNISLHCNV